MRYLFGFLCACALGLVPSIGCGEEGGGVGGSGGTAGSAGAAGSGGSSGLRPYILRLTEVKAGGSIAPLDGVEVCEAGTDNCALSTAFGTAVLKVTADHEIAITMEKEGYGSWVTGDVSDDTAELTASRRMYTHAQLEAIADDLQTKYPWAGGVVGLVRYPGPQTGVTFAPVGSTSEAVGDSFYFDAVAGQYSLDLEATTSLGESWLTPLGDGGFTEVTPGEQQFEFGGMAGNCRVSWGWPGDAPNTIRVPVLEGYRTYASVVCEDQ